MPHLACYLPAFTRLSHESIGAHTLELSHVEVGLPLLVTHVALLGTEGRLLAEDCSGDDSVQFLYSDSCKREHLVGNSSADPATDCASSACTVDLH